MSNSKYRQLIYIYKDGNHWFAIYPMGSNIMDCDFLAAYPEEIKYNEYLKREIDYGFHKVLRKIKDENPTLPDCSFYCEEL